MKVLFTFLTFGKDIFAGMENALYSLCKGMQKNGDVPIVYTTKKYGTEDLVDGIKVFRSDILTVKHAGDDSTQEEEIVKNSNQIIDEINYIIEKEKPDCIVVWDPLWGIVTLLNKDFNISVFLVHHVVQNERMIHLVNQYGFKNQYAVSQSLIEDLGNVGLKGELEILPNSIDLSMYENLKKERKGSIARIICNGRLSPEKGVTYCIEAFSKYLKEVNSKATLSLFSGSFPFGNVDIEKEKIMNQIDNLGISRNVEFVPNMKWHEIPEFIAKADVSILPSLRETFGISVLEAMAARTPVVCSAVGNLPRLTQGSAFLVEPENPKDIFEALKELNENKEIYKEMQDHAYEISKKYDSASVAHNFCENLRL